MTHGFIHSMLPAWTQLLESEGDGRDLQDSQELEFARRFLILFLELR